MSTVQVDNARDGETRNITRVSWFILDKHGHRRVRHLFTQRRSDHDLLGDRWIWMVMAFLAGSRLVFGHGETFFIFLFKIIHFR